MRQLPPAIRERDLMSHVFPLSPDFSVVVDAVSPVLPGDIEARIDALWAAARQRTAGLFNGPLLSLADYKPDRVTVRRMEYRHLVAALAEPDLAETIGLRPLGVTGLLTCAEGLVVGRRSTSVATCPGLWEPVPAGTFDSPDPAALILRELAEEVGIAADAVAAPQPVCLFVDHTGQHDIVYRLPCRLPWSEIRAAYGRRGTAEHDALEVVAEEDWSAFLAARKGHLIPLLRAVQWPGPGLASSRDPSADAGNGNGSAGLP